MIATLFPLFLFCISTLATPGPNNVMILSSGLKYGVRQSLPHYFGICIGFALMIVIVGAGFSQIFVHFPFLQTAIKYTGITYMLYLAWKIATSSTDIKESSRNKPMSFFSAVLFQWVNPKAWVMAAGAISTFGTLHLTAINETLLIAIMFFLIGLPATGIWLFFGRILRGVLRDKNSQKLFNVIMAGFLVTSIILIFI